MQITFWYQEGSHQPRRIRVYKNEDNKTGANWLLWCFSFLQVWALKMEKDNLLFRD